jgi:hypothetical protein
VSLHQCNYMLPKPTWPYMTRCKEIGERFLMPPDGIDVLEADWMCPLHIEGGLRAGARFLSEDELWELERRKG